MRKQNKTLKEIKTALPDINSEKVEDLSNALDDVLSVKRIFTSSDGQVLLKTLKNNCSLYLLKLISVSKDNPSLESLLALISAYSANIDLLSQLQDIKIEEEIRNQLDEAVKEALS